ncbi:polymer-forming cytoskeletal protein [Streptomyces griseus]|uniref:polymer-forming cytoskeletal protein n=1 Tax=Streptomyces griseus TaxID=1911 RepID=UPI0005646ECF|nr:polymer-forming cytoskeletal protein [Streptomyces griseus]
MASLSYEILTDPAPLQVSESESDEQSVGAVYIVISNPTTDWVPWHSIEVEVPCGNEDGHLTTDPKTIDARIERTYAVRFGDDPTSHWDDTAGVLAVSAGRNGGLFTPGDAMVLSLDGFPVSSKPGLVLLTVREISEGERDVREHPLTLSLLKQAPRVPRNFRPEVALVEAGENVVLLWDGPDTLKYEIQRPDGVKEPAERRLGSGWQWSPGADNTPKRDATYTLVATPRTGQQPGYFLTTTVQLRSPEFESVTATNGIHTPWAEGTTHGGRITFSARGAEIHEPSGAPGVVTAAKAELDVVNTTWVRSRADGAGWIEFQPDGIKVGHGEGSDLGTVTADTVSANGVNTKWVGERDAGKGWIEFPLSGIDVRKDGTQEWGTVAADEADLNGVNTKWVQGRDSSAGWIEFPPDGVNVFQGAGSRQWGTVAAAEADLNDLVTRRARVKERLTVEGGLTVADVLETQAGPSRLVVHGRLDAEGDLNAAGNVVVGGDLTVNGDLRPMRNLEVGGAVIAGDLTVRDKLTTDHERFRLIVHGESLYLGKVNANRLLSVRTEDAWIMHVNEDMVAIQGNLRVHGAFRSDS